VTDIALWVTQIGFCCAYTFFIKENIHSIIMEMSEGKINIEPNIIAVGCWIVFTLLCLVRKIEKFAVTHIFADVMIFVTVLIVIVYGIINLKDEGNRIDTIYAVNPETWSASIGFSVFSYEGIGTVLPIYEITKNPHLYKKIIVFTIVVACSIFLIFGNFCCIAWGDELKTPLITDQIKNGDGPNYVGWLVRVMFMINLLFSYPLIIYPALMINENYLFDGWEKSRKRQWGKNLNRALTCLFITIVTILLKQKLDKFIAILGAVSCTPVAFMGPALFHYKACAESTA
jgi:proton-coupled amino acid transporter